MSLVKGLTLTVKGIPIRCVSSTDSLSLVDGAGLACGIFEYLLSLNYKRPKVLAATHYHEIFENGFLPLRRSLSFGHMEVRVDESSQNTSDHITYLYKYDTTMLLPGEIKD
jgi:hypothetical protein